MKKITLIAIVLFLGITGINAQTISLLSGDFASIEGETRFNIQYEYTNMSVGKFDVEQEYIDQKVKKYNENEAGTGDKWAESWFSDRKARFEPKFEELLNKYLKDLDIFVGTENTEAKYTIILHTTFTEPGFNVYVTRKPALINVEMRIVETANPENVVLTIVSKNNKGTSMGMNDMDTGVRITEAYAKCGKELGKFLKKKL